MKKKEIISMVYDKPVDAPLCEILSKDDSSITFVVDKNLSKPTEHLEACDSDEIIASYLRIAQIDEKLYSVVFSSIADEQLSLIGSDVLFQCILKCFAEHRPLVLSPDLIWLVIAQTLSINIEINAEKYRSRIVSHSGKRQITVLSQSDILNEPTDWDLIFKEFESQINNNTKKGILSTITCDFSTSGSDERIASQITLMNAVKSYFTYYIRHEICGIPYITLQGTSNDWVKLKDKSCILKRFGLGWWHQWLEPILTEFINASKGEPNLLFWRSIVNTIPLEELQMERSGCLPINIYETTDGWFSVLFPFINGYRRNLQHCNIPSSMESEMVRVGFIYELSNGKTVVKQIPMELWAGIIGVEEDKESFALTPKIGWFIRRSFPHDEELSRLKEQELITGSIEISVSDVVPPMLLELRHIQNLILRFENDVMIPEWMDELTIDRFHIQGSMSEEYENELRHRFPHITIFNESSDNPWKDYE